MQSLPDLVSSGEARYARYAVFSTARLMIGVTFSQIASFYPKMHDLLCAGHKLVTVAFPNLDLTSRTLPLQGSGTVDGRKLDMLTV